MAVCTLLRRTTPPGSSHAFAAALNRAEAFLVQIPEGKAWR